MVRLREIPRTAAFAWSTGSSKPLLVTGTKAGAVDADFSDETTLELWDLNLDSQEQGLELQPIASISTDSRFFDIAWSQPDADHPHGIIAGALENGSLDLWDAEKLLSGASDAKISRSTKHTGAIKSVQFNPQRSQILATAGAKGELFIHNIDDLENPIRLGSATGRPEDIECVAWNRKVQHILATGSSGGFVTVWDLKTKKASLQLNNNRKPVSAIAWDPNNSTKLLTATPDDMTPVIFLWDLRNSNAPERTLQGHEQGVLSLSWCQQDSDLLISCGKDNRTIVWNPQTGERYGEFPEVTNWTFLTRFHPHNPTLSATASFDGKITIQTLQNTNPSSAQTTTQSNLDGEDFFSKAQTQPQSASFTLTKAPAWLERPIGASFGYGGKVIVFKQNPAVAGQPRSSQIVISKFSVDSDVGSATEKFEEAIKNGDIAGICETHRENAKTDEEKAEWQVLQTLSDSNARSNVIEYLGLSKDEEPEQEEEVVAEKTEGGLAPQANGTEKKHIKRLSTFFGDGGDGDDFLAELAATKGAKTDNPFHLLSQDNTELEDQVTKALILGNFEKAAEICIKENRMADAFIIANCGGKDLLDKVQAAYLSQKKGNPSYLRLLGSVIAKNLWDVVYNADLSNWKETMATLCTFADPAEFPDLCEALGDRILESGDRKDASFCYLVGSKLEKVVDIWIAELEEAEQASLKEASQDSTFSVHARSLQQFIEKVTVFRHVTNFTDSEAGFSSGWKLAPLYDKYTEYADIVAAHGQLNIAKKYLDLLPSTYPAAEVARNRVKLALQQTAQPAARQQAGTARATSARPQQTFGYQAPAPGPSPLNSYSAPTPAPVQTPALNPYAPPVPNFTGQTPATTNPYAPPNQGYGQPASTSGGYPAPNQYSAPTPYGQQFGAPPRPSQQPAPPPPKINKDVGQWNDVPMVTRPPVRKQTPSVAPITSPFPGQPGLASPPPASGPPTGQYGQRATPTPPPPPPKASGPPRNISSPLSGPPPIGQQIPRPPSAAANAYAPPPSATGGPPQAAHVVPRSASPYNAPPAGPPPTNRYAPAPAAQQYNQPPVPSPLAPPPGAGGRPPPSQYGPPPGQYSAAPNPYEAAPQHGGPPPGGAPPQSRPPVGPPPTGGPPPAARPTPPPPRAAAPPSKPRHPAGDRTHIPPGAQRLVDILSQDMQRVVSKAPPSFKVQVNDTQKRLNLLFDHLNNEELVTPETIAQLDELANALETKQYDVAQRIQVDIQRDKTEEGGNWIVGIKRLISMSKATP